MLASVVLGAAAAACDTAGDGPVAEVGPRDSEATPDAGARGNDEGGAGSADDGGAATCELPGSYGSAGCNACMRRACCGVITACEGEPDCNALQRCLLACIERPDAGGCYDDCVARHDAGVPRWKPVEDCWFEDPPFCGVDCT